MAHVLSFADLKDRTVVEFDRIVKLKDFFKLLSPDLTVVSPLVSGEPLL